MTREEKLLDQIKTLMRIMLISERTPPEHRHVIKFNPLDFHTLGLVRRIPGVKASAVCAELGIAPTTASSVIARLKSQGLIERRRCCFDRRAYELHLSPEGQRVAGLIHDQDMQNMRLFLSALTDAQQSKMLELLDKVVDKVETIETASG
ncbi:MAG: MarR family transcriptional regulator [Pseudomonadota bacterium]